MSQGVGRRIPHAVALGLACALFASGCANFGPGIAGTPCPVAWVPSDSIAPAAAALRARMRLRIRSEEVHLELIAEPQPEELVVVALARFGVRLFAVHQRGESVRVAGASTPDLERVAIWAMDALHRAYWIEPPSDLDAQAEKTWTWADETVLETTRGGATHREFQVPGAARDTRRVTIDYAGPAASDVVSIQNPWCGYEAVIAPIRGQGLR